MAHNWFEFSIISNKDDHNCLNAC